MEPQDDLFGALLSTHPAPMWIYDLRTLRFLAVNDAAVIHYGYSRAEFLGMRTTDITVGSEDLGEIAGALGLIVAARHQLRDSRVADVELARGMLEFRRCPAALVVVHDVTEHKRAAADLRESEMRKAAILDSVLDCIVTMDARGTVTEFNSAAERTFGYRKRDAIGRQLADLIVPARFREAHRAGLQRYLDTGEGPALGKQIEVTAVRADDTEIPVELAITPIRSSRLPIFTGVLRDITERRKADETRSRLAAIVGSSDDAILSTTLDGTVLTWNHGAERLFGYSAAEMIGRNRALLVPTEGVTELAAIIEKVRRGEPCKPFETQHMRKDGSLVEISLSLSPMTDPGGRVIGVSAIARDITERRAAEAERKRLNDEIQLQRLRVFRATMTTVQDIVNNFLTSLQLVRMEAEGRLTPEILTLFDGMIEDAASKLRTLGDLETVKEKDMEIGSGIEYPSSERI